MTRLGLRLLGLVAVPLLLLAPAADAQTAPQLKLLPESRVAVDGTSNRDDWTVTAAAVDGFVVLQAVAGNQMTITSGRFAVPSGTMAGGRGAIMDRLMHGALKSSDHPQIVYELVSATTTPTGPGKFRLATRGRLSLAGVTKVIEGPAEVERLANGNLRFTGSYPLQMSDYDIAPPTAMFGALRTGDRVVVHFDLQVKP
jgi:hypothetical protein